MRILRIRLQNLTSLRGPHEVDLTIKPLADAGLFAITGATGAGKTTLLDAVTLALYGRAARYGKDPNPEDMMSRHTGECQAEVEFEVANKIYRARWKLRRAGSKPNGNLQPAERHVYDAAGVPIAQNVTEANKKIEELTGLNYERFLRSVLLAQGEFSKFLKSKPKERGQLLENLTGRELYSRLGTLAFEQARERKQELEKKTAEIDALTILEDDELEEHKQQHDRESKRQAALKAQLDRDEKINAKIIDLKAQRERESNAQTDLAGVKKEKTHAASRLKRLESHRKAEPFVAALTKLDTAAATRTEANATATQAKEESRDAQENLHTAQHLFQSSLQQAIETKSENKKSAEGLHGDATRRFEAADNWLKKNLQDQSLAEDFISVNDDLADLKHARQSAGDKWGEWCRDARAASSKAANHLPKTADSLSPSQLKKLVASFLKDLKTEAEAAAETVKQADAELKVRRDHLDKTRELARIETHRGLLKEGEACPLCGATEHPHAHRKVENREIEKLELRVEEAEAACAKIAETKQALSTAHSLLKKQGTEVQSAAQAVADAAVELASVLDAFGVTLPAAGAEEPLRKQLKKRAQIYREKAEAREQAQRDRALAVEKLSAAKRAVEDLSGKLKKLKPLPESVKFKPLKPSALPEPADAETEYESADRDLVAAETSRRQAISDEKAAVTQLDWHEKSLRSAMGKSVFKTLKALREAHLKEGEVNDLAVLEEDLRTRSTQAETLLKDSQKQIAKLKKEKIPEGSAAGQFQEKYQSLKKEYEILIGKNVELDKTIKQDAQNRRRRDKGLKQVEKERKGLKIWNLLSEMIGSADGQKFQKIAQSITLETLVAHANRHLFHLNRRYSIRRDDNEPFELELLIEDHHQADARRPMSSLSGGESFLASLALALGLSDLTGRNAAIDTLFIDEGFGSLDGDTLDIAIASLERLRQRNKTVGVISHVDLLKERVNTQIRVYKESNGTSILKVVPSPS